jgi:hypothetical protein
MSYQEEKVRIIERRILRELTQFKEQHDKALAINILSAKYAKACMDIGGFPELIEAMRLKGILKVQYSGNGARTVCLPGISDKVWY